MTVVKAMAAVVITTIVLFLAGIPLQMLWKSQRDRQAENTNKTSSKLILVETKTNTHESTPSLTVPVNILPSMKLGSVEHCTGTHPWQK